ncbi:CapA family protein [Paenibacillus alkaliterrae]|uniref:CapA family protein n=1 Tax=Paenibacillus alkaliterrae TaxID=320909 RepID=UPI001F233C1E|nr:CapA family protein [Paenibacillus alkaliterrae]MCF2938140.1 CapA family protein [Paenibacillus alkaliterrae]
MPEIKLAAVGDILMIGPILTHAKLQGQDKYDFNPIFEQVAPCLNQADFVIGNQETPLAGREPLYTKKNARTGFSMFNCPDELASALRDSGFHFLTTANNHCMDRGEAGLTRTLEVLDKHGLEHTGTFAANPGDDNHWIGEVKGIRMGILSYTKSTNGIPLPKNKPWMVNMLNVRNPDKLLQHVRRLKCLVDVVIVCIHAGTECRPYPNPSQRRLVQLLLENGAHIVLGCHPHVIQPMFTLNGKFAIYSMGNFASTRLYNNSNTNCGLILQLTIAKEPNSPIKVSNAGLIPTWVTRLKSANGIRYKILPIRKTMKRPVPEQSGSDRDLMQKVWKKTSARL